MTVRLPAPFDGVPIGHMSGARFVEWALTEPGQLHRNRYHAAWVEVREGAPWRGEPLHLSAYRRVTEGSWSREPFTEAATKALHAGIVPLIARYGFDRLWRECCQVGGGNVRGGIDDAERYLAWWRDRGELVDMFEAGMVDLVPVDDQAGMFTRGERIPPVAVYHHVASSVSYREVSARVMVGGEQVGWMTRSGELVPARRA